MNARQLLSVRVAECNARSEPITGLSDECELISRSPDGIAPVGECRHNLTDEQREAAISRAGASLERHMLLRENALFEYDVTGDFGAKAEADRHRTLAQEAMRLQTELIRGRSPEVVARLEMERGLA